MRPGHDPAGWIGTEFMPVAPFVVVGLEAETPRSWGYSCHVCDRRFHGYATSGWASEGARGHARTADHRRQVRERAEREIRIASIVDAVFELFGLVDLEPGGRSKSGDSR